MLSTTSGLETEWDYSGRKERDGQKKKIVKANEKREKWPEVKLEDGVHRFVHHQVQLVDASVDKTGF